MYAKQIKIINYGPIDHLEISFPFRDETPKPVVLVGENGSGKSIFLAHIVNGLVQAQCTTYPETPAVELGKVFKLRGPTYIKSGREYYFSKTTFENGLHVSEFMSRTEKRQSDGSPDYLIDNDALEIWNQMPDKSYDRITGNINKSRQTDIDDIIEANAMLYFPHNRFEEAAWLNHINLNAKAQYMDLQHLKGHADRNIIDYSPLRDNQNWLFDLIYDRAVFELRTSNVNLPIDNSNRVLPLPVVTGYSGEATTTYDTALQLIRTITRRHDARFGIGTRKNRVVSLETEFAGQIVPNIFQMSSGETSLLNLFLSILRDFDLANAFLSQPTDIRGIVLVDEIDLHLHAIHQHEVLPRLIQMFPKVQFIVTTHSPLFVLGMRNMFSEDGFGLYRLPTGHQINPEEFSEFGDAYAVFKATRSFEDDMQTAIKDSILPSVFVDGSLDVRYISKAAELLGNEEILARMSLVDGGGKGNLKNMWGWQNTPLATELNHDVVFLHDCDDPKPASDLGRFHRRTVPWQENHPISSGIENLFSKTTLEKARAFERDFFVVTEEFSKVVNDEGVVVPEMWSIVENQKTNLCNWLCENGDRDDFEHFGVIFDMLEEVLEPAPEVG